GADVFRLQYLVVLVGTGLVAVIVRRPRLSAGAAGAAGAELGRVGPLRRPRLAACAAVLAAVNFVVLGIPLTPSVSAASGSAMSPALRLVVANVEVGNTDFAAVERLAARTHPDLFGVTEL